MNICVQMPVWSLRSLLWTSSLFLWCTTFLFIFVQHANGLLMYNLGSNCFESQIDVCCTPNEAAHFPLKQTDERPELLRESQKRSVDYPANIESMVSCHISNRNPTFSSIKWFISSPCRNFSPQHLLTSLRPRACAILWISCTKLVVWSDLGCTRQHDMCNMCARNTNTTNIINIQIFCASRPEMLILPRAWHGLALEWIKKKHFSHNYAQLLANWIWCCSLSQTVTNGADAAGTRRTQQRPQAVQPLNMVAEAADNPATQFEGWRRISQRVKDHCWSQMLRSAPKRIPSSHHMAFLATLNPP